MPSPHESGKTDWTQLRSKAKSLMNSLILLDQDLDLILNHKTNIYIAIDFYDLVNYVYPNKKVFIKKYRDTELKKAISREVLFNMMGSIYTYPIILLPPYLSEINDFFYIARRKLLRLEDVNYKNRINNGVIQVLRRLNDLENADEKDVLAGFKEEVYYLTLFYSKFFSTGLVGLKNLLQLNFTPNPSGIPSYSSIIGKTKKERNDYFSFFKELRPHKAIQNIRDSRAIQYVKALNQELAGKNMICFISSSIIMSEVKPKLNMTFFYNNSIKYDPMRHIESIYYYILAIYFSLGINAIEDYAAGGNFELDPEELKILHKSIKQQINLLNSIPSITDEMIQSEDLGLVGGEFSEWIDRLTEFNNIIDKLEKDIWLTYTIANSEREGRQINKFFNLDVTNRLDSLKKELERADCSKELSNELKITHNILSEWVLNKAIDSKTKKDSFIEADCLMWCIAAVDRWEFMKKFSDLTYLNEVLRGRSSEPLETPNVLPLKEDLLILYDETKENKDIYLITPQETIPEEKPKIRIFEMDIDEIQRHLADKLNKMNSQEVNINCYDPIVDLMNIIINNPKLNIKTYDDKMDTIVELIGKIRNVQGRS